MYKRLVIWLGKSIIVVLRATGRGGAALPGLVVEKIYPKYIASVRASFKDGVILVTGTNGKTTTTKLLAGILKAGHKKVVTNQTGSNMSRGIASALLEASDWRGRIKASVGLFEVDEAFMGNVAAKLDPKVTVVLNLLRDQLDRYGELDRTAQLIAKGLEYSQAAVLNGDDPLVANLAASVPAGQVMFFGAAADLKQHLPHDGLLLKPNHKTKPTSAKFLSELSLLLKTSTPTESGQKMTLEYQAKVWQTTLKLQGVYNAYNALAALAATTFIENLPFKTAVSAISKVTPAFGRTEQIKVGNKKLEILLIKNPSAFNQVIKTFLLTPNQPILMAVNDNFADGRDVSWLWDVDFEQLAHKHHQILTSGTRGYDMATRLKYTDIESSTETDLGKALNGFISDLEDGQTGYIVPTYTAMLALRRLLAKKTEVAKEWL